MLKPLILTALLAQLLSPLGAEELRLAILGPLPEGKSLETRAAQLAVEAANLSDRRRHDKVRLVAAHDKGTKEGALEAAGRLVEHPGLMGVVLHGEDASSQEVIKVFQDAGVAAVAASSWATPRGATPSAVTWLSPSHLQMAELAAEYARKGKKAAQVAVIDDGAPTAAAAARAFSARFKELGGRINYEGEWQGTDWGLTRTVKALKANWPQTVFFTGNGNEAGQLVKAMHKERELKETNLLGLPSLMDPEFFNEARLEAKYSTVVFPCPEYSRGLRFSKHMGVGFAKGSPADKAYLGYANKPGRWAGMVYDGAQLLLDAMERAAGSAAGAPPAAAAEALSPSAQAPEAVPASQVALTRAEVLRALNEINSYKGIRGLVKFSQSREPLEARGMIFYALRSEKKSKEMRWYDRMFGPPFKE